MGAIALLLIDLSIRRGFRASVGAALGAASADLIYASLAALAGGVIAGWLAPYAEFLRAASGWVLVGIGAWGLWRLRSWPEGQPAGEDRRHTEERGRIYWQFLGLTILNPMTFTYFTALILGGSGDTFNTLPRRIAFVVGAALASASWQIFVIALGSLAKRHLSTRFQTLTSVLGNLVVAGLGVSRLLG